CNQTCPVLYTGKIPYDENELLAILQRKYFIHFKILIIMPNPKQITISGYDAKTDGVLIDATLTYDMSNGPGSPITAYAFKKMVKRYIDNATTIGDTNRT